MSAYEEYIEGVLTRLQPLVALGYEVAKLPDAEAALNRPVGFQPRVTVACVRSRFTNAPDTMPSRGMAMAAVVHEEFVDFEIVFETQLLYGDRGYYAILEKVILLITGHRHAGWVKAHVRETEFRQHLDGIFQSCISFSTCRRIIEAVTDENVPTGLTGIPAEPAPPLLVRVDYEQNPI